MKKINRIASCLLVLAMIVCALSFGTINADAASKGKYTITNPIDLGTKGTYSKVWTNSDHDTAYFKFNLKKNGYATFNIVNPVQPKNKSTKYCDLIVTDSKGNEVWYGSTEDYGAKTIPSKMTLKVGLKKGTYYLCVKPASLSLYDNDTAKTDVSIQTKADNYYEIESNNSKKTATNLKLKKTYKATFCDEDNNSVARYNKYDGKYEDWYKIKVKKGKKYTIKLGNYKKFKKTTTIIYVLNDKNKVLRNGYTRVGYTLEQKGKVTFKAQKNGYVYIRLWNCGNKKGVDYTLQVK